MPADELGQGVDHDICAMSDWLEEQGGGHGVVDNERDPAGVCDGGQRAKINHVARRIANGFTEHRTGGVVHQGCDGFGPIVRGKAHLDPERWEHVGEVGERRAVELRRNHEIGTGPGHRQDRTAHGRHARRQSEGGCSAFEGGEALLEDVDRRVIHPVVVESGDLEVEDRTGVLGIGEFVSHGLVDGHGDRAGPVGRVAPVNGDGLVVHAFRHSLWLAQPASSHTW